MQISSSMADTVCYAHVLRAGEEDRENTGAVGGAARGLSKVTLGKIPK